MTRLSVALIAVAGLGFATSAQAQTNPSANKIINALKPTGTISGTTRGIRPAGAPAPAPIIGQAPAAMHMPMTTAPTATAPAATMPAGSMPAASMPTGPAAGVVPAAGPSINLSVQFANGSAALTPAAMATLDQLGTALSSAQLKAYRFRIAGHTDTVGSASYNLTLSQQRAAAVAQYLETKFGIAAARLEAVGLGEAGLLVPTPPQTAEPRNRRVQVINLGS